MKIIFISHSLYPENSGQAIYSAAIARRLTQIADVYAFTYVTPGTNHTVFSETDLYKEIHVYAESNHSSIVNLICKLSVLSNVNKNMLDDIIKCTVQNAIDVIVIDHICMAGYYYLLRKKGLNVKFVYSSHNIERLNIVSALLEGTRTKHLWRIRALLNKNVEKYILTNSDCVISISQTDMDFFRSQMNIKTKMCIGKPRYNYLPVKNESDIEKYEKRLLIVGTMSWYPNIKGTLFFAKDIFSKIHCLDREYELYIVGKNPTKEIIALQEEGNGIVVTGYVEDIDEYYRKCDIAIIPIYEGTGLKIKLIEAVGKGIPVITSKFVGKDYEEGSLMTAESYEQFLSILKKYESDLSYRKRIFELSRKLYDSMDNDIGIMLDAFS